MLIIEQKHEILSDVTDLSLLGQQIEERGRICYKSEAKITPESYEKFITGIIKQGHNSVLEMGRITLEYPSGYMTSVPSNFIEVSVIPKGNRYNHLYYTGSVRAWREVFEELPNGMANTLFEQFPMFFFDKRTSPLGSACVVADFPVDHSDYKYHKYQAVKLITNRAMTHEIVRMRPCSFLQESQRYVDPTKEDGLGYIEFIKPFGFEEWPIKARENFTATCYQAEQTYIDDRKVSKLTPQQCRNNLPNSTKTEIIVYASLAEWMHIFYQRTQGGADPMMKALMCPVLKEFRVIYPGMYDILKPSVKGR